MLKNSTRKITEKKLYCLNGKNKHKLVKCKHSKTERRWSHFVDRSFEHLLEGAGGSVKGAVYSNNL